MEEHWLVFPHELQGLTREEILEHKPVGADFLDAAPPLPEQPGPTG
jgi:hypothetical protein